MAISKSFLVALAFLLVVIVAEGGFAPSHKGCGHRPCHKNAKCIRFGYSFKCRCNRGYYGDGYSCRQRHPCYPSPCHKHAKCFLFHYQPKCACRYGYKGDGKTCEVDKCYRNRCSRYAYCTPSNKGYGYDCTCKEGYNGNGYYCRYNKCYGNKCHKYALCYPRLFGYGHYCKCQRGYWGNGKHCIKQHYNSYPKRPTHGYRLFGK